MNAISSLARLQAAMRSDGIDAVALGPTAYMHYVGEVHPHACERPCLLVVTPTAAAFLVPALNQEQMRTETDLPFHVWADAQGPDEALAALIDSLGIRGAGRVDVDEAMRTDFALLFLDAVQPRERRLAFASVGQLRMRKTAAEIAEIDRNAAIDDEAMEAAYAAIRPGMRERELADVVVSVFARHAAKPLFTIVGAGENGAFPHHTTGQREIRAGDAIVIDIGARQGSFSSDITRMAFVGEPTDEYRHVHDTVERAVQAALAAARPGVAAKVVDAAARDLITEAGYGEYFVHRTGHGMGLEGHEQPYITETSETILEEGMVFSIEPGIYLPGKFGIRLEEIVVLEAQGPRIVSRLPRDVFVVPV